MSRVTLVSIEGTHVSVDGTHVSRGYLCEYLCE